MSSLNALQARGLRKIGSFYCPGASKLPEFHKSGCEKHWERVFSAIPPGDQSDILLLLAVLGLLPAFVIAWVFGWMEKKKASGFGVPPLAEKIRVGVRGIVFSLYYTEVKIGS